MIRDLVKEFVKVSNEMRNGDYAKIAMVEALTNLALKDNNDLLFELRKEVLNNVE